MAFSTTSFFAGVGTVFVAVTLGFAGGAMITSSPQMEPNRLERVAASAQATPRDAGVKAATADARSVTAAMPSPEPSAAANTETSPTSPDRVISLTPIPGSQQAVAPQPAVATPLPVVARYESDSQADNVKKARDDDLKKAKTAARRAERRRERRAREIEAAENSVLQMPRDDRSQEMPQRYDSNPRLVFFGNE
jgi:hypothetical protein